MVLNSLSYLHDLQIKSVNIYEDLVRRLQIYLDAIHILSPGYLPIKLIPPSQLNEMFIQVKDVVLK